MRDLIFKRQFSKDVERIKRTGRDMWPEKIEYAAAVRGVAISAFIHESVDLITAAHGAPQPQRVFVGWRQR
jgi:hypothetical protein